MKLKINNMILTVILIMFAAQITPLQGQGLNIVSGTVIDITDRSSLAGVNVIVKGTTIGVATDLQGSYRLAVPSLQDTLVFSLIGFGRLEVPIAGRNLVNVEMLMESVRGDEIVVVGYSTQRQRDVTGSITTVRSDQLNPIAQTSVNQMLRGKAPGLNMSTRSAQPGGGVSVNIRGAISPGGSNSPLYVIDGVPITDNWSTVPGLQDSDNAGAVLGFFGGVDRDPLSYLNPSDIESITILKDASATAIYGSAAANGVVLITTRGGQSGDIQVEYRSSFTTQTPHDYFPLLNAREFMEQQDRLAYDYYLFQTNQAPYGNASPSTQYNRLFTQDDINSAGTGTNWFDLISRNGSIQEHNIAISGGSDKTRLFASFNAMNNEGILRNSVLTRYSGRVNIDQTLNPYMELKLRMSVSRVDANNTTTGGSIGGAELNHMIQAAYAYAPNLPVYNEDGSYMRTYNTLIMNPVSFLDIDDQSETNNVFLAPNLQINLSSNLTANVSAQYDSETSTRGFYLPRTSNHANLTEGMAQKSQSTRYNYSSESYFTYRQNFKTGSLTAVLGAGYYKTESEGFGLVGIGFFTDAFGHYNVGVSTDLERNRLSSWRSERTKLSQFMRVNYTLMDKYNFAFVARRDGSSIFSENNKYGVFPGISAAWTISEEAFLSNVTTVSELKLRAGYGLAGNESVLSGNTFQLYSPGYNYVIGGTLYNGVTLTQIANPDLTWEKVHTLNIGLDFGFFANRIRGSFDFFEKTAKDLLAFNPLPFNNAVGLIADNVGSTRSRGYELSLSSLNLSSNLFRWSTDLSVSHYESHWVERNPQVNLASYIGKRDPLGAIYGWKTAGIIQTEADRPAHMPDAFLGNVIYVDKNGDGLLNSEDVELLGTSIPKWTIGLNNTFAYKTLELSVYIYGNLDFKRNNNFAPNIFNLQLEGAPQNTTRLAKDIWSSTNPTGTRPGVASNPYSGGNPAGTDFDLEDASFIRLGDISLSYTLPQRLLNRVPQIRSARFFGGVRDIAVFTGYSGFDPEYTEANPYPKSYSTTFGLELKF